MNITPKHIDWEASIALAVKENQPEHMMALLNEKEISLIPDSLLILNAPMAWKESTKYA
tara:strand:- start:5199 stop:5375 length:177 start_codon:yes stop_codon:yes gene_type:complete